ETNINLIPTSTIRKLNLTEEIKPTRIYLQLTDNSIKYPSDIIKNIIIKIKPFTFPTDFIILKIEKHKNTTLILEKPFLTTERTLIDVQQKKITLRINENKFKLNIIKTMQHPDTSNDCLNVNIINSLIKKINITE
ncbi:hypothetical protein DF186_14115, partial [Enterococcus hirae]